MNDNEIWESSTKTTDKKENKLKQRQYRCSLTKRNWLEKNIFRYLKKMLIMETNQTHKVNIF